jgi:hypothetical protein
MGEYWVVRRVRADGVTWWSIKGGMRWSEDRKNAVRFPSREAAQKMRAKGGPNQNLSVIHVTVWPKPEAGADSDRLLKEALARAEKAELAFRTASIERDRAYILLQECAAACGAGILPGSPLVVDIVRELRWKYDAASENAIRLVRELEKLSEAESRAVDRAETAEARLRETAQVLIAYVGASGPCDAEDAARRTVARAEKAEAALDTERDANVRAWGAAANERADLLNRVVKAEAVLAARNTKVCKTCLYYDVSDETCERLHNYEVRFFMGTFDSCSRWRKREEVRKLDPFAGCPECEPDGEE